MTARSSRRDQRRPDFPHTDGIGPWLYKLVPTAGTARADVIVRPVDLWPAETARERYGPWGRALSRLYEVSAAAECGAA